MELHRLDAGGERRREQRFVGIDEHADRADMRRHAPDQRLRLVEAEIARRGREEHEADMARPAGNGGIERLGRGQAADLGGNRHAAALGR